MRSNKGKKKAQTRTKASSRNNHATTEQQTMRLGALAGLTDPTVGQGHITTVPASTQLSQGRKSCFYKLHMQQSQHRYRQRDKLKTEQRERGIQRDKETE